MRLKHVRRDDGFTLIEVLIVVAVIGVLAAIAIAELVRARASANEAAAISSLRAISAAQVAFIASCGNNGFATTLTSLGSPGPGSQPFVSPDLSRSAVVVKSGYSVTLSSGKDAKAIGNDCHGDPTADRFYSSAEPTAYKVSGTRSFAVTTDGQIWEDAAATSPTEPFTAPASPLR